jgi:hypothetical protein
MAILAGVVLGGLVVGSVEWLGHWLYPLPTGLDIEDPKELALAMADLPIGAFLMVQLAWFLGAACSAALASWLGKGAPLLCGVLAALVMLAFAVMMLIMIPSPLWFILLTPLVFALGGGLGMWPAWQGGKETAAPT